MLKYYTLYILGTVGSIELHVVRMLYMIPFCFRCRFSRVYGVHGIYLICIYRYGQYELTMLYTFYLLLLLLFLSDFVFVSLRLFTWLDSGMGWLSLLLEIQSCNLKEHPWMF